MAKAGSKSNLISTNELFGYVDRITFQNEENGFTIAHLKDAHSTEPVCIVGSMPALQPGETIRCKGEWKKHLIYGHQFTVESYKLEQPADVIGIKKYLGSGLIKGIGPRYAARIVEKFGENTLNVIDQNPNTLLEVEGLGQKRVEKIIACWSEQRSVRDVMVFLQGHGVSPAYAQKIFKRYGQQSIKTVRENPYQLARDIFGIGFKIADAIAQKLGVGKNSSSRIEAGIEFVLSELASEGHVCYPEKEFFEIAKETLEVESPLIESALEALHEQQRIERNEMVFESELSRFVWGKFLYIAESGIGRHIHRLRHARCLLREIDTSRALEWVQTQLNIKLADNQMQAVTSALTEKVQIITGGPGTGKSTITKAILAITEKLTSKILLAAPTGRAAKRMTEITGKKASTIHSLLEFDFKAGKFKRGPEYLLDCDLIIVDEASMIDTALMYSLLKAIPDNSRVIFVGDINQLPSVGPGNVLKDMISSKIVPVTILNEIFRQAAGSRIVTNAHRINHGVFPDIRNLTDSDFFFLEAHEPEDVLKNILGLVTQRLSKKYGFHPLNDIQVLAPMKKGVIGTESLNYKLQETLNPQNECLFRMGRKYQLGDKVMQIRNDYKKEVYNGDIGRISSLDLADQHLTVTFDEREVEYEFADLDELVLAYAVSIHKYQGSECPCVVIPVHTTHFKLLHRNLLYTGVTRGKKMVVLVGTKKALILAIKNDEVKKRYTGLQQALTGVFQETKILKAYS